MNVFDFVTQEEIENAPEDPSMAFTQIVALAQGRLKSQIRSYDYEDSWKDAQNDKISFQNFVIGLAKAYDISPFNDMQVPDSDSYTDASMVRFSSDLDHYMTQMVIGNTLRAKRDAVPISDNLKGRIRSYVHHLKSEIDATSLPDAHKSALHSKILEFEALLDKSRVNMWAVTRVLLEIMSVSANGVALYESVTVNKLISNVMGVVAEAKSADNEQRRLPSFDLPQLMTPPRPPRPEKPKESSSDNLDNENPF